MNIKNIFKTPETAEKRRALMFKHAIFLSLAFTLNITSKILTNTEIYSIVWLIGLMILGILYTSVYGKDKTISRYFGN